MSPARLVVLGDTLMDSDLHGTAERLCPDAPVPVVDVVAERPRPGGAGLAALLAAMAGREVVLVTALGADRAGGLLTELLCGRVDVVRLPLRGTTVSKTRVRVAGQSLLRIDSGDGQATDGPVGAMVTDALCDAGAVLVADYGRGVAANPSIRGMLAELSGTVPVVWDPHPKGAAPVAGCRLVTPNQEEAVALAAAGDLGHRDPVRAAAARLRHRWDCAAVAVTLGARGALLCTAGQDEVIPVPQMSPLAARPDACGAGDSFAAAAAAALFDGAPVEQAAVAAVNEATRFVAAGGAGSIDTAAPAPVPRPAFQRAAVPSPYEFTVQLRRRGGRLVATGGCFDLLHPGHVSLLRQARALGDGLVVCVNSDESVRRLKGPGRPIVPLAARAELLMALEPVDAVAVFDEDTPTALLELLRPDVWVKGGDYEITDLPEADVVHMLGGEVVLIPVLEGYSTSRLVAAARDGELAGRWQGGSG